MHRWTVALVALAIASPVAAQAGGHHHHHGTAAQQQAGLPEGWSARLDRDNASMSNVRFVAMDGGFHVTLGPSGIFYRAADVADGVYTASAQFTQISPTRHPEGYGLLVGGQDLDGPGQDYLYFLIRQDGRFLIKHRAGEETHTIQDWTAHRSIVQVDGDGGATNTLAIEAGAQATRFLVNGEQVASLENAPHLNTAGVVGLRINHNLDVHVQEFGVRRGAR